MTKSESCFPNMISSQLMNDSKRLSTTVLAVPFSEKRGTSLYTSLFFIFTFFILYLYYLPQHYSVFKYSFFRHPIPIVTENLICHEILQKIEAMKKSATCISCNGVSKFISSSSPYPTLLTIFYTLSRLESVALYIKRERNLLFHFTQYIQDSTAGLLT
jgi:hypothetical protein